MIVYRCLSSEEILYMINNKNYNKAFIKGENTFHYDKDKSYKHFFLYAEHAFMWKSVKYSPYVSVGQFVIPDSIVDEYGFGFYTNVETIRNDKLKSYQIPLPEIKINEENFNKDYLYKLSDINTHMFIEKRLDNSDNIKYNEISEERLRNTLKVVYPYECSYADVYYEIVYRLAKKYNYDMYKVSSILKRIDLHAKINEFYNNNYKMFDKQYFNYKKKINRID